MRRWLDKAGVERKARDEGEGRRGRGGKRAAAAGGWCRAWATSPKAAPSERARLAEVRLAEALAVLTS